jgi:hypothetical protein
MWRGTILQPIMEKASLNFDNLPQGIKGREYIDLILEYIFRRIQFKNMLETKVSEASVDE